MKLSKIFGWAMASALLLNVSCRNGEEVVTLPKGDYENGILMANEGNFGRPNADLSFVTSDLTEVDQNIYSSVNGEALGDVLQSVGFYGDKAYLVVNNSNKIVVANRYTMKKEAEISNVTQPRYVAFSNSKMYVTSNNFWDLRQVNVYDGSSNRLKTINFDRYAEKIVSQSGYVYVQTDGVKYELVGNDYKAVPTGHTIGRINASTDEVMSPVTLPDEGVIRDLASAEGVVYALSSDDSGSYVYKINASTGGIIQTTFTSAAKLERLAVDNQNVYCLGTDKESGNNVVYSVVSGGINKMFSLSSDQQGYVYAFNVIDGRVYTSNATFTQDSKVSVYSAVGTLLKEFTAGMGTNAFYKN
ncbi:DUF5074 domain-containing protein [Bergeyella sp. RCAD1439]|uniref:DUF5074 domain-containing protein n=1 Tax=Bergeyella anatis TaxID=3113737 RepID=UPI002E16F0A1|nr:DUF5074 domain-containing protein [Bergeyella sp. RCAD1439]